MKQYIYILSLISFSVFGQQQITAALQSTTPIKQQTLIGIDNFGTHYAIQQNTFSKTDKNSTLTYTNIQLGAISTANAFNPLKINLFYENFNTAIILDNRLAEIFKIDFNTKQPYKNVSHISTGYDNTLWIFNQDNQQLELYDYKADKVRATAVPVQSNVLDMKSNYNYCWLLTENHLYTYNYFGSAISKLKNSGFTAMSEDNGNIVLKSDQKLYYLSKDSEVLIPINLPELLINRFLLTNETLYIYDDEMLHQFQLKIN